MGERVRPADETIRRHVQEHYRRLFAGEIAPSVDIPQGRRLARALGYPPSLQALIPAAEWTGFAPVGNPLRLLGFPPGSRMLNLGCGVGLDTVALRLEQGGGCAVVSLDVVPAVVRRARDLGVRVLPDTRGLSWLCSEGDRLPFGDAVFDVVWMNGVASLFPEPASLLAEVARVLAPGGFVILADLAAVAPLPDDFAAELDAWAWCMGGAQTEGALRELLGAAGFVDIEIQREEELDELFRRVLVSARRAE